MSLRGALRSVTIDADAARPARRPAARTVSPLPPYTLRRSARSRGMRVTIDPARGVLVSVPPANRRGWARPEPHIERFLREREPWLRRHLERHARQHAEIAARGGLGDGATIRYRGELLRLRIGAARPGMRRSVVRLVPGFAAAELTIELASPDRRPVATVLEGWLRDRARELIDVEIARHAGPLGVSPAAVTIRDQRSRWGSASRHRRLSFSWRLVLAPPEALETVVVHELAHLRIFGHGPAFWALVAGRRSDHLVWRRWLRTHSLELHAALADEAPPNEESEQASA
ncbi:MAG TPA: SprT family zinc-dependent metalloprotease [Candidatus Limnocylindrales bacterium]|nr:SprT family zinc-dependent metalloprotease [Candidatus Limnocylindrales bacterium]